jgi:hypothetical protein
MAKLAGIPLGLEDLGIVFRPDASQAAFRRQLLIVRKFLYASDEDRLRLWGDFIAGRQGDERKGGDQ